MKKIQAIYCLAFFLLIDSGLRAQTGEKEQLIVPLSNPGKPYSLEVSLMTGSIEVTSYSGKDIVIDVSTAEGSGRRRNNSGSRDTVEGMQRITPKNSYEVTATEKDNNVMISNTMMRNIHLSLKIPQEVKLRLHTVNNGNIEVTNVKGQLEVTDVNGGIKLTNISGSVVANTVNGNITANFISVDPQAPMAFSTLNGNVDVTLPAGAKSNLKLRSDRGDIFTDFEIAIDKDEAKSERNSESGMYMLKLGDWVNGKINGGGAEILMKNMSGNIYVRKGK